MTSIFAMALVLMLYAGAAELTMSQWSSLFAEQGLGMPNVSQLAYAIATRTRLHDVQAGDVA